MTDIFLKFVNMGIAAGWMVLAVIVLRLVLRKAPKWLMPVLWGIVALRLVLPVSIQSIFSLIPSAETISPQIADMQEPQIHSGIAAFNQAVNPVIVEAFAPDIGDSVNPLQIFISVAAGCWIAGIAVMLLYAAVSYWRLYRRMSTAVLLTDCIYQSEYAVSPFVLGIVRPRIYLPFRLTQKEQEYVIAHEQAHIKCRDHWWKPIGFLLLSLYWYNPVIWAAYVLFCKDIELACDERVVKNLDAEQRADYSQALLSCSAPRRTAAVCPLAFGETGVTERVRNVLHYKRPAFWVIVVAVLVCVAVAVCFLTNPREEAEDNIQWAVRPAILMDASRYIDPYMPASKLPYGYAYAGTIDSAQANDTGLEGCAYYTSPYNENYIYVYQECGTPIDTHSTDSTQRQWMYQPWLKEGSSDGMNQLTLEEVQRLSEFGNELTWTDFEQYDYVETGSGLYIRVYEMDEMFSLWIGGGSTADAPMYIYLRTNTEPAAWIDIRTQDVSAFISAQFGTAGTEAGANVYQVQFPAHEFDKTEYNAQIFEIEPFTLQITLPENWSLVCPQSEEEAYLGGAGGFCPVLVYEGDKLLGSICYNTFEVPQEGEYGIEYVAIYNQLMLGAQVNWNNNYQPVAENETNCTAVCKISVDDPETGEERFYPGILSYDKELGVYIAIDFIAGELSDEDEDIVAEIAESILLLHGSPQE
ncbi:MAG: M56 family metallopeptidase [Lachnospiraceae bacterium]|nr:M56 family metallopeptidase [Lachnospiraceae bacterium]